MTDAKLKLRELAALKANWGGDGELPISPACLDLVRRTLAASEVPEPFIVPGRGGGVQLEWELKGGHDVELEFRDEEIALLVAPAGSEGWLEVHIPLKAGEAD